MKPFYQDESVTIYHGDCREVLPRLGKASLVVADPPYNGVLDESWDNQWKDDQDFLAWLDVVLGCVERVVADNGTLYCFASPRLASRVELCAAQRFRVIANVTWDKGNERNGAAGSGVDLSALRTYWTASSERIIVGEKLLGDDVARDASGYWSSCESAKRTIIGDYLKREFERAHVTNGAIAALFPSKTGGLTGCVSNWLLGLNFPTKEQYITMRAFLNSLNGSQYLRREYEDLRREFNVTRDDQWGDVWRFSVERNRLHPAQKPKALINQIVRVSSRVGDTIIDPFMGSGTTLHEAKRLGRRAIGIDTDEQSCEIAALRLSQGALNFNPEQIAIEATA